MQPEVEEEKAVALADKLANRAEEWCKSLECPEFAFGILMFGLAFDNFAYAEEHLVETIKLMEEADREDLDLKGE